MRSMAGSVEVKKSTLTFQVTLARAVAWLPTAQAASATALLAAAPARTERRVRSRDKTGMADLPYEGHSIMLISNVKWAVRLRGVRGCGARYQSDGAGPCFGSAAASAAEPAAGGANRERAVPAGHSD